MSPVRSLRNLTAFLALLLVGAILITPFAYLPAQAQLATDRPDFVQGEISTNEYDGIINDLLTAGLGAAGFAAGNTAPAFADPTNPTAAELRRRAIFNNYLALVPNAPGGGYGTLFGPAVGVDGDGKIPGKEYLAFADDGPGAKNVTLMVQIPNSFDPAKPCIITAPSSGSRGIYGAIGTSGEWGLKKGCAVAYTDKGTGLGVYDLASRTVNVIDGTRTDAIAAGQRSNFTPRIAGETYLIDLPNRIAIKHAHSRQNPEADWGLNVLQSIEFAFYVLNLEENFGASGITPANTTVIAASVSNGAGASIRAAEQDTQGLIDGIAISEPNVQPMLTTPVTINQGSTTWSGDNVGRTLLDYYTYLNLYQACANLAPANATAPLNLVAPALGAGRCQSLREAGLLTSDTLTAQAIEAQEKINAYGILTEQNILLPSHFFANTVESISVLYANSYGRFGVEENLCGFSYAQIAAGVPITATAAILASQFSDSNGIPPSAGLALINDRAQGGAFENRNSLSSNGRQDQNLDGALCLRRIATGQNLDGSPVTGVELEQHQRIMQGISEVKATGNLRDVPLVIVNGRNDAVLGPNHTSRPTMP
ncbi:MAG: D-(-)-3-hydroxybutyrate oligomer hydrolase [Chloroflexaceae bacterium]|nr:D-(-)-3-hydroxybutyrate oligomer hydrolase [Chloroflexaceae bacterium]